MPLSLSSRDTNMKHYSFLIVLLLTFISCQKIENEATEMLSKTKERVQKKTEEKIKKTVDQKISETLNAITKSEDLPFTSVFPDAAPELTKEVKGRKFTFPNGSPAYIYQYKADKEEIIAFLENQKTTDESRSEAEAKKIDGRIIIEKISLLEKFIPENTISTNFIDSLKTDQLLEFYKVKRYPNNSTIIYNPKTQKVYHFVEVHK